MQNTQAVPTYHDDITRYVTIKLIASISPKPDRWYADQQDNGRYLLTAVYGTKHLVIHTDRKEPRLFINPAYMIKAISLVDSEPVINIRTREPRTRFNLNPRQQRQALELQRLVA